MSQQLSIKALTCLFVNVNALVRESMCISHEFKKMSKRKEAEGDCRRMNELVKGQRWFSLKTNYWCWEGTAVWLGSNSPATSWRLEASPPAPHSANPTNVPTLLHPTTPWECCQPGRWGETGSGKDKTPSHWDLNWNKAKVKRGGLGERVQLGGRESIRVSRVWELAILSPTSYLIFVILSVFRNIQMNVFPHYAILNQQIQTKLRWKLDKMWLAQVPLHASQDRVPYM